MNARNTIFGENFSDLNPDAQKLQFAQSLLVCDHHTRIDILNDQFHIDPDNLTALLEFLATNPEVSQHAQNIELICEISLVLSTPSLYKNSFITLDSSDLRNQFVFGLLTMDADTRHAALINQHSLDNRNIEQLLATLKNDEFHPVFVRQPSYELLLKNILAMKEPIQSPVAKVPPPVVTAPTPVSPLMEKISTTTGIKMLTDTVTGGWHAICEEYLNDPIDYETFINPMITPPGVTHTEKIIKRCLENKAEEPTTRAPLKSEDLIPNHIVSAITKILRDKQINPAQMRNLFTCPLSGELFTDPVVAADGQTYERAYIQAWLDDHKNRPPLFAYPDARLYPNLFMKNLIELKAAQELLAGCETRMEKKHEALIKSLREYQQIRLQEGNPWFFFSYRKTQKIGIAVDAKRVLSGKMSAATFFSRHDDDLSALTQGRLGTTGSAALAEIEKIRNSR